MAKTAFEILLRIPPSNCIDKEFIASCSSTIKTELEFTEYENYPAAHTEIVSYFTFYNTDR